MTKLLQILEQEWQNAPIWQKLILIVLFAILLYFATIKPSLVLSAKTLKDLDKKRDNSFRQLQAAKYLLEDSARISENYLNTIVDIAENAYTTQGLEKMTKALFKEQAQKIYALQFPENERTNYGGIQKITLQAKINIFPDKARSLISDLSAIKYCHINYLDLNNRLLLIDAQFLANNGITLRSSVKKKNPAPNTNKNTLRIHGFLSTPKANFVLINGRTYSVGDRYGSYTIITLDPKSGILKLKHGREEIVIRKQFQKGVK